MTTLQTQALVPSQYPSLAVRHSSPEQHGFAVEHDWPPLAHCAAWQVPLVEPEGITQLFPVQQSAEPLQVAPVP